MPGELARQALLAQHLVDGRVEHRGEARTGLRRVGALEPGDVALDIGTGLEELRLLEAGVGRSEA